MPEEQKDVKAESSPAQEEQEVVTNAEDTATATDQQEQTPDSGLVNTAITENEVVDKDERGVPWKNRALEYERKFGELADKIPSIIEQKLNELKPSQPQEYTFEQIDQIVDADPRYKNWGESEKEKLRMKRIREEFDRAIKANEKAKEAEIVKQRSYEYVVNNYPQAFQKDSNGRPVAWDNSNPLTMEIGRLMQDPRLANEPDGLVVASDLAFARLYRNQMPKAQNQVKTLKKIIKKQENAQMIEGSGKQAQTKIDPTKDARERLQKSGSIKDASELVAAHLRSKGFIK